MVVFYFDLSGTLLWPGSKQQILKDCSSRSQLRKKFLIPETFEYIKVLKKKPKSQLGIITNTKLQKKSIEKILYKLGIRSYFKHIIVSCNKLRNPKCQFRKPNQIIFDYAASKHPKCKKFVYIGNDKEQDIKGAKRAGWETKLVKIKKKKTL